MNTSIGSTSATNVILPQTIEPESTAIETVSKVETPPIPDAAGADIEPAVAQANVASPVPAAEPAAVPAETPESEDRPDKLIGRVDDHSNKTVAQRQTVSTITPLPNTNTSAVLSPYRSAQTAIKSTTNDNTSIAQSGVVPLDDVAPMDIAESVTAETDTDATSPEPTETKLDSAVPESDELIAMANIWQLGVNELPLLPEDVVQPEVEIVSIVVVEASNRLTDENPVGHLGAVQVAPPLVRLPGAVAAKNPDNPGN